MDNNQELVSIIIPMYNAEKYIGQTIKSILTQTYKNYEIIIVDDNSTDKSVEVVSKLISQENSKIRLISDQKLGTAARARNCGIKAANGRYICYLDADDLWKPTKLEKTIALLNKRNGAFAFTAYEFGDEFAKGTGKIVRVPQTLSYEKALSRTIIFTSTVMFDMKKISKEEIYMPDIKSEDTASWWKILRSGYTAYGLNENLVTYRRLEKSLSSNKIEAIRRIWFLYRKQEKLPLLKSIICLFGWAYRATFRRL